MAEYDLCNVHVLLWFRKHRPSQLKWSFGPIFEDHTKWSVKWWRQFGQLVLVDSVSVCDWMVACWKRSVLQRVIINHLIVFSLMKMSNNIISFAFGRPKKAGTKNIATLRSRQTIKLGMRCSADDEIAWQQSGRTRIHSNQALGN
jgi:hypothetical protein